MSNVNRITSFIRRKIHGLDTGTPWARASLARLRRGAGKPPGETPEAWDVTLGDLPEELFRRGKTPENEPTYAEWAIHTALTLYALHKQGKSDSMNQERREEKGKTVYGNSLGTALRQLVNPDKGNEPAIKKRFDTIATSKDLAELSYHAKGLIQLLRANDIPLDYPRFAADLYSYQFSDNRNGLRLRWGEDFWRNNAAEADEKEE
jgi:CRISPR system Cascade subunit CasB